MGHLFDDLNRVELLPNPLAEAAREMLVEAETWSKRCFLSG